MINRIGEHLHIHFDYIAIRNALYHHENGGVVEWNHPCHIKLIYSVYVK